MPTPTLSQPVKQIPVAIPTAEQIRARAYEIYFARGQQPGHAMDDWLQAEYELVQLPIRKLVELSTAEARPRNSQRNQLAVVALIEAALVLGSQLSLS